MFRYHFDGAFTTGVVTVAFGLNTWNDSGNAGNRAFSATFEVRGATGDLVNPGVGGRIGSGQLAANGYLEITFRPTCQLHRSTTTRSTAARSCSRTQPAT